MHINELIAELKLWFGSTPNDNNGGPVPSAPGSYPPLCYVVDDEPGIRGLISSGLKASGVQTQGFDSAKSLLEAMTRQQRHPHLIFLDISLERSDAIEVLRDLKNVGYEGRVNLMSGQHRQLLEEIKAIGDNHKLRMLPPLLKPFDVATVRRIASANLPASPKAVPRIAINDALRHGWMKVWYQPKIDLKAKKLAGCEALARIEHPEHGIISPGHFIPGADTDSLSRLTEHVLLTVMQDFKKFGDVGASLRPAVNIPVDVLLRANIAGIVRENRPSGHAWKGLIVEVTEDQIVKDIPRAQEVATQLKIYNISLSIDDFGAGYSSLQRLKHFPFAELKIDMSFVKDCASNPQNAAICKAVIDLAHSFNAVAVAEGIESPQDLRALHEMGCDLGQGYLLAAPMPIDRFLGILKQRKIIPGAAHQRLNKIA